MRLKRLEALLFMGLSEDTTGQITFPQLSAHEKALPFLGGNGLYWARTSDLIDVL